MKRKNKKRSRSAICSCLTMKGKKRPTVGLLRYKSAKSSAPPKLGSMAKYLFDGVKIRRRNRSRGRSRSRSPPRRSDCRTGRRVCAGKF